MISGGHHPPAHHAMMFVFHVDEGRMLTFEMSWMFEDIRKLKGVIERYHAIPAESIVLLVSGGELLEDDSRVCKYATGTDTNPIYMFSRRIGDAKLPSPGPSKETEVDLEGLVKKSLELPVSYATVASRVQLAQNICEMGREELRRCELLVHEQHLQQQGWAAVLANLEDSVKEFQERSENFGRFYEDQLRLHEEQKDILIDFDKNLQQLKDIPILPTLMENTEMRPFGMFEEQQQQQTTGSSNNSQSQQPEADPASQSKAEEGASTSQGATDVASAVGAAAGVAARSNDGSEAKVEADGAGDGPTTSTTAVKTVAASGGEAGEPDEPSGGLTEVERAKGISLLDWISAAEGQLTLKRMAEECRHGIEQFNRARLNLLRERIDKAVKASQNNEFKIVKGLEERLCDLDQLMASAKKIVQDQIELAHAIQMNHTRANTLGDTSILPDLCSMHRNHLKLMKDNQLLLRGYRKRCKNAKEELGQNLTKRLEYIIGVETKVCELDSNLLFCYASLKRLQKHLSIIEQIHMAPCMYVSAVTEVVRRRMFSSSFLRWASDLACRLMTIHSEEVERRQEFTSQFEGHFLNTLFPGMNDMPPSYAIQAPSVFDSSLPALNKQDLEELSRFLPELTEKIPLPNIASVIDFFQTRSVEQQQQQPQKEQTSNAGPQEATGKSVKDSDKIGAESETDTEEFEKVQNQSPLARGRSREEEQQQAAAEEAAAAAAAPPVVMCSVATSTEPVETVCAETLTEDNLGTTRLEVEKLKGLLGSVHRLSQDSIAMLRDQLARVRSESESNRTQFQSDLGAINRAWNDIQEQARHRERETIQRLTVDHELEMNDLRKSVHQKDDEIQSLRADNSTMKASQIETVSSYEREKRELAEQVEQMQAVIGRLERQLAESEVDRKRAIQEAIEQLEHKHRTEIETLRCRFKLMATSMDRSPSDTSLEKIERPDMIDTGTHEQVLAQLREEFAREKERAIRAAVEEERQRWEANATPTAGSSSNRLQRSYVSTGAGSPGGSQDVYKRILEEKERQLEEAREKEALLARENLRMKETIQSLTDPELSLNDPSSSLAYREQLEALDSARQQLADRLAEQLGMVERLQGENSSLTRDLEKQRRNAAQLLTCSTGDTVLYVWNSTYCQYTILQWSEFHFFLHESCYTDLGLAPLVKGETPATLAGVGTVVHKEFCHARKDDNRYRVSRGTQFYRVKLKQLYLHRKGRGGRMSIGTSTGTSTPDAAQQQQQSTSSVAMAMNPSGTPRVITVAMTDAPSTSITGRFLDSFAQTEQSSVAGESTRTALVIGSPTADEAGSKSPSASSRDMIDSGVVEQQRSSYRERNISITDEEDMAVPPGGIGSSGSIDRIRYQSVCEDPEDPPSEDADGADLDGRGDDGGDIDGGGGGSSATAAHLSCYTSATDASAVVSIRTSTLPTAGLDGSCDDSSIGLSVAITADSGNNSEASETVSSGGATGGVAGQHLHLLSATQQLPVGQPEPHAPGCSTGFGSIADDVSDSADSEYRSLEANDQEDSDSSAPAPLPPAPATSVNEKP